MSWLPRVAPQVNTKRPLIYLFQIESPEREYRYVGKSSNQSRFKKEYQTNVEKILAGKPRRERIKKNGDPQSVNNLTYRRVHLLLAIAIQEGWKIKHTAIENVTKENIDAREDALKREWACDLNGQPKWAIKDYSKLKAELLETA
ncbi:MAG: hypothetical protein DRR42_24355 [Gammaproteobacteria bacterium]|nr:MAG: hypothetical protein DRR42_24355 [Gammaproteobacteria bacterium]